MIKIQEAIFPANPTNKVKPMHVVDLQPGEIFIPLRTSETANGVSPSVPDAGMHGGYLPYFLVSAAGVNAAASTAKTADIDQTTAGLYLPASIGPIAAPFGITSVYLHWPYGTEAYTIRGYVVNALSIGVTNPAAYGAATLHPTSFTETDEKCADRQVTLMNAPFYTALGDNKIGTISMLCDPSGGRAFTAPYPGATGLRIPENGFIQDTSADASVYLANVGASNEFIYPSDYFWPLRGTQVGFTPVRVAPTSGTATIVHVLVSYL